MYRNLCKNFFIISLATLTSCSHAASKTGSEPKTPAAERSSLQLASSMAVVDIHLHCLGLDFAQTLPVCNTDGWRQIVAQNPNLKGVLLSLEHLSISTPDESTSPILRGQNRLVQNAAQQSPSLEFFASLRCWHQSPFDDNWLTRCKEEADQWSQSGAQGFKDHAGKQFAHGGRQHELWLGSWNRFNQFCESSNNSDCMEEDSARFPVLTPEWRSLVAYITETLGKPIVTHTMTFPTANTKCFNPLTNKVDSCHATTKSHLLDFADWAQDNLSIEARRRVIVAHAGFLFDDSAALRRILDAGLSIDTSAMFHQLRKAATNREGQCQLRAFFDQYQDQIVFGSDAQTRSACLGEQYRAWQHILKGSETKTMSLCGREFPIPGLDLDNTGKCGQELGNDIINKVVNNNYYRLFKK